MISTKHLRQGQPWVMGIVNLTQDSFFDGGAYYEPEKAVSHAKKMIADGAQLIDVGAESTRPGAQAVPLELEWSRLAPVLEALVKLEGVMVSVDTQKTEIMRRAIDLGVDMINSVNALGDQGAKALLAEKNVWVCLMHMHQTPATMQKQPLDGEHGWQVLLQSLRESLAACLKAGIRRDQIIIDPGFGFGKTPQLNWMLIERASELRAFGYPLLLGASRKSSLGLVTGKAVDDRLIASVSVAAIAAAKGYDVIRAHDVAETYEACAIAHAIHPFEEKSL